MKRSITVSLRPLLWSIGCCLLVPLTARAEVVCRDMVFGQSSERPLIRASTPSSDFVIHDDGTVTHVPSGLMWMRCIIGQTFEDGTCTGSGDNGNWLAMMTAAQSLNHGGGFAGHTDWRVPNVKELSTIVEHRCNSSPKVNQLVFPGIASGPLWTSSAFFGDDTRAISVNFHSTGATGNTPKDAFGPGLRLVRDAP